MNAAQQAKYDAKKMGRKKAKNISYKERKIANLKSVRSKHEKETEAKEAEIKSLQAEMVLLDEEISNSDAMDDKTIDKRDNLGVRLDKKNEELSNYKSEIGLIDSQIDIIELQIQKLREAL